MRTSLTRGRPARWLAAALALLTTPALAAGPELDARDLTLLGAATWGVTVSTAVAYRQLGRERWLEGQFAAPADAPLPEAARAQIEAVPAKPLLTVLTELDAQQKAVNAAPDPETKAAAQAAYQGALNEIARASQARTVLRALYGSDQLRERMSWFWFNRFNVHVGKANGRATVGDYMDTAIRPHALGRFRDLLGATLRHPAMLRYLDNAENAAGRLNENYARELMELHTMGVGSGYSQGDVEALARILTGVGIDIRPEDPKLKPELRSQLIRAGAFMFNPARHDYSDKVFLGHDRRDGLRRGRDGARFAGPPPGDRDPCLARASDLPGR